MKQLLIAIFIILSQMAVAQTAKDTTPIKPQVIKVKSSFKPVLRNANKQSFYATPPAVDSVRQAMTYNVPSQNLFFSYQPVPLKPLALLIKTDANWNNSSYVKVGYGNLKTPFISAAVSMSDGKSTSFGLFADYIGSKGPIKYQQYSKTAITAQGSKTTATGFEFKGKLGFQKDNYNQYGYNQSVYNFSKSQVAHNYNTIFLNAGVRNTIPTEFGLNYNPTIGASLFTDNRDGREANIAVDLPFTKNLGKNIALKLGVKADFTFYKGDSSKQNNNIFYINPAFIYKTEKVSINAGVTPAWDNGKQAFLPDVTADFQFNKGKEMMIQAGVVGYFNKGTYQNWANYNPFIGQPKTLFNAKVTEGFAGVKGTKGNHMVYSAKLAFQDVQNVALFLNDTGTGKNYRVAKESSMQLLKVHAEAGLIEKDQFQLMAGATLNNFLSLKDNSSAWGLLPLELNASLRWRLFKELLLKADAFMWDGAQFKKVGGGTVKDDLTLDLNAGIELKVAKKFDVWFQGNNILANKYYRWNQYESYSANFIVGVKYTFDNKPIKLSGN